MLMALELTLGLITTVASKHIVFTLTLHIIFYLHTAPSTPLQQVENDGC